MNKKLKRLMSIEHNLNEAHCASYDAYNVLSYQKGMKKLCDRAFALYADAERLQADVRQLIVKHQGK